MRFLIVNSYAEPERQAAVTAGITAPEILFRAALDTILTNGYASDVVYIADLNSALPHGSSLADYDGVIWSGSSLTAYHDRPEVTRQIDFVREVFRAGVPSFGSCFALQIAVMASGGACRKNPRGGEIGLARSIRLTAEGRGHPMFAGKPTVFDAPALHYDEVEVLPACASHLATNRMSTIQAAAIDHLGTPFWAVQYHPEFGLDFLAALYRYRAKRIVEEGYAENEAEIHAYADDWQALHDDPGRTDVTWRYGIDLDMIDPDIRYQEIRNFIRFLATPRAALRTG